MEWLNYVYYFLGGMFFANSIPHLVCGLTGRPFQSPFAKPPGQGLSSSTVNVVWGSFNLVVAYGLLFQLGAFDLRNLFEFLAAFLGGFVISFFSSRHFAKFHGGNLPK